MGYYSEILLLTKIKKDKRSEIREEIAATPYYQSSELRFLIDVIKLTPQGYLKFRKDNGDPLTEYKPDANGLLPAATGTWYDVESFASWLAPYAEEGSRIHIHSMEADGRDWAYEFDGKGQIRILELRSSGGYWDPKELKIGKPKRPKMTPDIPRKKASSLRKDRKPRSRK